MRRRRRSRGRAGGMVCRAAVGRHRQHAGSIRNGKKSGPSKLGVYLIRATRPRHRWRHNARAHPQFPPTAMPMPPPRPAISPFVELLRAVLPHLVGVDGAIGVGVGAGVVAKSARQDGRDHLLGMARHVRKKWNRHVRRAAAGETG